MKRVGRVQDLWRYPVKSMAGERLGQCQMGVGGIPGDRAWALRDQAAAEIRGAKKFPILLQCAARFLEEPAAGQSPPAEITLPDGRRLRSDDAEVGAALSKLCLSG